MNRLASTVRSVRGPALLCVAASVLAFAAAPGVGEDSDPESYIPAFRDYAQGTTATTGPLLYSPLRSASSAYTDDYPPVVSKWQQPRNVGTPHHQGTDVRAATGTKLYAPEAGCVVWQSGKTPSGAASGTSWGLSFRIDWNRNGSCTDDNVYMYYDHVERVGYVATNTYVNAFQQIATTGSENGAYHPHLHFGVIYPAASNITSGGRGEWASNAPHYNYLNGWRNGASLDLISKVVIQQTSVLYATAFIMDEGNYVAAATVDVLHRQQGETTWRVTPMYRGQNDVFTVNLNALGYGRSAPLQYMVRATRTNPEPHNAAFFPPKFAHPNPNPNAVANAYPFYTFTTTQ